MIFLLKFYYQKFLKKLIIMYFYFYLVNKIGLYMSCLHYLIQYKHYKVDIISPYDSL